MRIDIDHLLLPKTATMKDAMRVMTGRNGIVMVVGKGRRLLGVVVDSDMRRAMLGGLGLETRLARVMNPRPRTFPAGLGREAVVDAFKRERKACVPFVDKAGRVLGLAVMSEYLSGQDALPNTVVLLVGGEGRRLRPLTEDRPKPLLPVGGRPILETILQQFVSHGLRRFVLAVSHQGDQIRRHFADGSRFGAEIRYVEDRQGLGTAGPLSLLPSRIAEPLIVMNGDLLTNVDFRALLSFHGEEKRLATMCVREYDFQVPYGVAKMKDHTLLDIEEKPTLRYFVNAGIYVLEPKALRWLPKGRCEMPDFLKRLRRRSPRAVGCFPIREYWLDIGQMDEYRRAQSDHAKYF